MDLKEQIRLQAEKDLEAFIRLVAPYRVLGSVHRELIRFWTREGASSHQLALLPRDHQKSAMIAYYVAWYLTNHPDHRVLYISSTSNLASKQLKFIKDIFTSDTYRYYWPEMVNEEESKREKWTEREISLDHPLRKKEGVRDPSIFTAGLTTGIVGMHCDLAIMDDVVVNDNAYTEEGRTKVKTQYSLLSSIESTDSKERIVGTRYHPKDLYNDLQEMEITIYGDDGEPVENYSLFEVFEKQVETRGDGTGEYLWPRQQRYDGKWFGFNQEILARKKAQYLDKTQFYAQYYNNPNNPEGSGIPRELFQYYSREYVRRNEGRWYFKNRFINVFASIDFAYSLGQKSDYSAIVVVGVDSEHNYYILDIERFKTDSVKTYFDKIMALHQKWQFRKLRAEVTAAQSVIVKELKDNYIKRHGLALSIDEFRPNRWQGTKEERVNAILIPKYENQQVWHYEGGNCQILEDELTLENPPHDDVKDCLASAIDVAVAPSRNLGAFSQQTRIDPQRFHSRFGGVN